MRKRKCKSTWAVREEGYPANHEQQRGKRRLMHAAIQGPQSTSRYHQQIPFDCVAPAPHVPDATRRVNLHLMPDRLQRSTSFQLTNTQNSSAGKHGNWSHSLTRSKGSPPFTRKSDTKIQRRNRRASHRFTIHVQIKSPCFRVNVACGSTNQNFFGCFSFLV